MQPVPGSPVADRVPLIDKPVAQKVTVRGVYSTPSIQDALRDDPNTESIVQVTDSKGQYVKIDANKSFTLQELLEAWTSFVSGIDTPQLKSALSARSPKLANHWKIDYELDNELQFNRLTFDLKPKLLDYLRRKFENESIEILFTISENTGIRSDIPYTDEERWNLLLSRYPTLGSLKTKFGLDFEHY